MRIENPPLHIILSSPKIPQNVGNIGRTCSMLRARLHLIRPLGFVISDTKLKRSGMDYWNSLDVVFHDNWEAFLASPDSPKIGRTWLLTTKSAHSLWSAQFEFGDGLLFGAEDCGVPEHIHDTIGERRIKIPQFDAKLRSLNLATSVGIASYEAARQISLKVNL